MSKYHLNKCKYFQNKKSFSGVFLLVTMTSVMPVFIFIIDLYLTIFLKQMVHFPKIKHIGSFENFDKGEDIPHLPKVT